MNPIETNETTKDMQDMGQSKREAPGGGAGCTTPKDMICDSDESTHGRNLRHDNI